MPDQHETHMIQRGRAWVFGHNVPNDGGIMTIEMTRDRIYDPPALAKACMKNIDAQFAESVRPGDFLVAGRNFGRGQLHVQGPLGISALGLGLITESMSRSFFRLSVSVGLKMLPFCSDVTQLIRTNDEIEVDFREGRIRNLTTNESRSFQPLPKFLLDIVAAGGERPWLKTLAFKNHPEAQ